MEHLAEKLSDRFGGAQAFYCNSGTEAVEAAIKWARKATGRTGLVALEGSFHGRTMGALSITGQPAKRAPFEPLRAGRALRDARDARRRRRARHGGDLPRAGAGRGRRAAALGRDARAGARARGRVRGDARLRRGADRDRPHRRLLRLAALGRAAGCAHAREGPGERAPDRRAARRRRQAERLRARATTPRRSAATRSRARPPARSWTRSTTTCSTHVREIGARFEAAFDGVRGAGLLLAIELDRPALPVAHAALEHGLLVGTAGETALRLTPPLTISARRGRPGDRDPARGARSDDEVRAAGRDPAPRRAAAALDAGRGDERAPRAGLRRRAGDGVARHRAARAREGAERQRPPRLRAAGRRRPRTARAARRRRCAAGSAA